MKKASHLEYSFLREKAKHVILSCLRGKIYVFTTPAAMGKLTLCAFLIIIQLYGYFKERKTGNVKQGFLGALLLKNSSSKIL